MSFQISNIAIFNINSAYRLNIENSDVNNFNYEINIPDWGEGEYFISVVSLDFPVSMYSIRDNKNTFYITEDNITYYPIILDNGNYSIDSIAGQIQLKLNTNPNLTNVYTVSTDADTMLNKPETGKLTISHNGTPDTGKIKFLNSVSTDSNEIYAVLGFDYNGKGGGIINNGSAVYSFSGNTLISPYVCNLAPDDEVYIYSDIVLGNNISIRSNILLNFSLRGAQPFSSLSYDTGDIIGTAKPLNRISSIFNFQIADQWHQLIDLNNADYYLKLAIFKKDNTFKKIDYFIKYLIQYNEKQEEIFKNILENIKKPEKENDNNKKIKDIINQIL